MNRRRARPTNSSIPRHRRRLRTARPFTRYEYTDAGRVARVIDDLGNATSYRYDVLGHRTGQADARGNTTTWAFDADSNLVGEARTEKSDLGRADRSFTQTYEYDGLDRLVRQVDSASHAWRYMRDGAGCVLMTNPRGNQTRYVYDGFGRLVQTIIDTNGNGPTLPTRRTLRLRSGGTTAVGSSRRPTRTSIRPRTATIRSGG